jgi:hypothetical protein
MVFSSSLVKAIVIPVIGPHNVGKGILHHPDSVRSHLHSHTGDFQRGMLPRQREIPLDNLLEDGLKMKIREESATLRVTSAAGEEKCP